MIKLVDIVSVAFGHRTKKLKLLGQWLADLLISSLVAVPFAIPVLIERDALVHHTVELVDVWQFDSEPANDHGLRKWGAGQNDLQSFRVNALTRNQLVLRYLREKRLGIAVPDWQRLGYVNQRLLSTDRLSVQDSDLPRTGSSWSCVFAASFLPLVVLIPRLNRAWSPDRPWKMPAAGSWKVVLFVLLASVALDGAGRWWFQLDAFPLTSAERIFPQLRGWASWMAWCSIALIGPAMEETLYRGCLFGRFRLNGYVLPGALLSAFAFSVAHGVPSLMPKYFCNGLLLAWVCHRTGSLWPPFAVHASWNVMALLKTLEA